MEGSPRRIDRRTVVRGIGIGIAATGLVSAGVVLDRMFGKPSSEPPSAAPTKEAPIPVTQVEFIGPFNDYKINYPSNWSVKSGVLPEPFSGDSDVFFPPLNLQDNPENTILEHSSLRIFSTFLGEGVSLDEYLEKSIKSLKDSSPNTSITPMIGDYLPIGGSRTVGFSYNLDEDVNKVADNRVHGLKLMVQKDNKVFVLGFKGTPGEFDRFIADITNIIFTFKFIDRPSDKPSLTPPLPPRQYHPPGSV